MSEQQDSLAVLASTGQAASPADSPSPTQDATQEAADAGRSTEPESNRVNGLMSALGKRTTERDQAIAERDQAQQALTQLQAAMQQHQGPDITQQDMVAADEQERTAPPPRSEPVVNAQGEELMTAAQWQKHERDLNTFAPVMASRAASTPPRDEHSQLLAEMDRAIAAHMRDFGG